MQGFFNVLQTLNLILLLVLIVFMVLAYMIISQMNRRIQRMNRRYNKLLRGYGELDMESLVVTHGKDIDLQANRLLELAEDIEKREAVILESIKELDRRTTHSIQNIGFHRYNAFDYSTNELSFTIVLLDESFSGVILTSIYGSDNTITYAKEVKNARALQEISTEEELALGRALKTND